MRVKNHYIDSNTNVYTKMVITSTFPVNDMKLKKNDLTELRIVFVKISKVITRSDKKAFIKTRTCPRKLGWQAWCYTILPYVYGIK